MPNWPIVNFRCEVQSRLGPQERRVQKALHVVVLALPLQLIGVLGYSSASALTSASFGVENDAAWDQGFVREIDMKTGQQKTSKRRVPMVSPTRPHPAILFPKDS